MRTFAHPINLFLSCHKYRTFLNQPYPLFVKMKFNDYPYQRPDMEAIRTETLALLQQFEQAKSADEQSEIIHKVNQIRSSFSTMQNIAYIRYSIDTTNEAYNAEQEFFDENMPIFGEYGDMFYRALINSKFREALEAKFGKQFFNLVEVSLKTFSPDIIEDMQRENHLVSEYTKIMASAKLMFEGKECNLSDLYPYEQSANRDLRQRASEAKWGFIAQHTDEFDRIYDELVQLRHNMAQKLGFKNFVELGYLRMARTDYNAKMVANYRQQVLDVVVPLAAKLRQKQVTRIGIDKLKYYDHYIQFKSGNPTPKGDAQWIVSNSKMMYEELSSETSDFINFMINNELMDLVNRKGKAGGGYCTFIENYKAPFIFSNFNGTAGDINVLTHEAGHAFQVYMSRNFDVPEYYWPTTEACEIHSMSMEFLTWPWMNRFFKEDTEKFKFDHLSGAVLFLPYGVSVDEFQHFVYENPSATPQERKQAWRAIEKKYLPWTDCDGNEFLENGGYWQRQAHIFASPFYYIDYTLAQICAFQFWHRAEQDRPNALADYIELCKAGGSQPFLQLVKQANLVSPFADGCLEKVVKPIAQYLENVDDAAFA